MSLLDLVGDSPPIVTLREQAARLAERQASGGRSPLLLLQGETGTGKGLLARSLHRASPRHKAPFVAVNCAALPATLLEAELFGFERGAFTDARQAKPGLFQAAHGGTLFLDEVGALPLDVQAKLLTALDDRIVRRLGSTRVERVDIWIIAAASEDLGAAVHAGGFRQDLWYRLSAVTLRLPPLRERGGDVLLLAEAFLARACADYGIPQKRLDPDARDALVRHRWPGNVRELANVMERVALLCEADEVSASALAFPGVPVDEGPAARAGAPPAGEVAGTVSGYRASLDRLERAQLLEVLERTGWNVSRAAEQLGVPRNTLRYRIARHGLRPEEPRRRRRERQAAWAPPEFRSPAERDVAAVPRLPRQRAVSFLRVVLVGAAAEPTPWAIANGLELVTDKIVAFGGRVIRRDASQLDGAFGLEPAEDAPGRAANAALAIRRLAERARSDHADARMVAAIETVTCLLEERQGEIQLAPGALHDVERALATLIERAPADAIVVGPGAAPHLERQFAVAPPSSAGSGAATLVRREAGAEGEHPGAPASLGRRRRPFVGRSQEVTFLQSRLRQVAETGRGHLVSVMGEPGMGKSRLLGELGAILGREGVPVVEGRCASHGTATPYSLLLDLVRRTWHLDESETPEALAGTVRQHLSKLGLDEYSVPVLLGLLGLRADALSGLSPEAIKGRAFDLFRRLVLAHARGGPIVLLLEDLHWADQTSQEFLGAFADSLPGAPVLCVATTRPGYRAPWLDRSWASQIALPALSLDDSLAIVRALRPDLPGPEADTLARRAEGNPFFVEELARAFGDGAGTDAVVPGTITDVIRARMDRLPPEPLQLLETAAVLGREAPLALLEAVTGIQADALLVPLGHLVAAEFLYEQPGPTFVFKHALTNDVAYERLAPSECARLHEAAGRAYERLFVHRTDEVLHHLAHHWSHTDDHARAIHSLRRLGIRALNSLAPSEALAAFEQALRKGEQLPEGPERERTVLSVVTELAVPLMLLGRTEEVKTRLLQYQPRVERLDEPGVSGPFFAGLAFPHDHTGALRQAEALALRALESATHAGDETTMGKALMVLTLSSLWAGRFAEGVERADRAVAALTGPGTVFWRGLSFWVKAHHETLLGRLDAGLRSGAFLWELGVRSENRHFQSYGTCFPGWVATLRGDSETALERCEKALELAPDPYAQAVVRGYLGEALEATGRHREAREQLSASVDLCRRINFPQCIAWNLARLSVAELGTRDVQRAHIAADEALALAQAMEFPYVEALARRALGLIAHRENDLDGSVDHLAAARAILERIAARYHEAVVRLDLAVSLARLGSREQAATHLADAADHFRAMAIPFWEERAARVAHDLSIESLTQDTSPTSAVE